ncbi:hypothetical protein MTBBW1_1640013 [Desulfamplus magnetovallimortis]|uniref:Uncharacterized protein n=1 Tax=Desulfamplus magnetovallimortis TaxID=1246637 RepID=A0A1W1H9C1_9BACT|nr:hypothetical protein MTBBW1_1640013 [Desulfamplus magnetovallimortis]
MLPLFGNGGCSISYNKQFMIPFNGKATLNCLYGNSLVHSNSLQKDTMQIIVACSVDHTQF